MKYSRKFVSQMLAGIASRPFQIILMFCELSYFTYLNGLQEMTFVKLVF
jgi:hypothetical protein